MLFLKYVLMAAGFGLFAAAAALVIRDLYKKSRPKPPDEGPEPPVRWREAGRIAAIAWLPLLLGLSIVVVSSGEAGVRVSQVSGTLPGTLYPVGDRTEFGLTRPAPANYHGHGRYHGHVS